ncbi:MAG: TetR/AcrR family transcriptional regulator [Microthrixaceae bacterium]
MHEAILDATEALIVELPYKAVTVEGIASRAGVGKSTVYRWWPTKEDLVLEVILERWYSAGDLPSMGSVRQDLIEHVQVNVQNQLRRAGELIIQVAFNTNEPRTSPAVAKIQMVLEGRRDIGRQILQRAIAEGTLPPDADLDLLLDILAGTALFRSLKLGDPGVDTVEPLVDLVLSGTIPKFRVADNAPWSARS